MARTLDKEKRDPICPLCLRPIPEGVPQSQHHLIPKLKGGKGGPMILMHHICHREIHATLTEAELARSYHTPEALRAHPRLAKFAAWVAKRPPSFRSKIPGGMRKR
ncbi:HNH endonuclease [uncultured Sulfitobacter sp.]|uniref:HNH endonuclease n=1 Tax=uncultured Sulfitobacter sp. TaxID=191468 RepID=UPI002634B5B8|nr:HNH endonuclease [uncultured Sulfitobacter sp.]